MLRLAASLDQVSQHVLAAAVVRAARERGLPLGFPAGVAEQPGWGIQGEVEGRHVALGKLAWVHPGGALPAGVRRVRRRTALEGSSSVFVGIDGHLAGALILHDPLRPDSPRALRAMRRSGIERVVLVTGDHPEVAETVGAGIGADLVLAERSPQEKVAAVVAERAHGPVLMVGDGINDAPALAAADVGVAMGARGATASAEAADVVVTVDRLDRLGEALAVARRSRSIALQSVVAGMGLSLAGMLAAAAGYLPPVAGALLQEAIDVAVIANALRALGGGPAGGRRQRAGDGDAICRRYRAEHGLLLPDVDRLRIVADRLDGLPVAAARSELAELRRFLEERLLPHERTEDDQVYPLVARAIGGEDPTAAMSRAHLEIAHLVRLFGRLVDELPPKISSRSPRTICAICGGSSTASTPSCGSTSPRRTSSTCRCSRTPRNSPCFPGEIGSEVFRTGEAAGTHPGGWGDPAPRRVSSPLGAGYSLAINICDEHCHG